ncbi:unnamed protein product [[Actinomadura] parvosata subsp. kistnae]|uniref:MerR family transcriptional regulator n=1 Tax=[Actinomadura] parvosata TaxID=1955412 RepID=UPI000D28D807|nr:MerR family transcriptional regulator [Nonomuraea sp. ATCC 55076]SPL96127.1 unnamed protein product [Actinomadura parvosata subsp. kistnae]
MSDTWTIGELAEHAARTLRAGAPSPPNGRVRDVPSERLIRWYTTIGLVDPPLTRRGRIARYGRRHLLQLVAVKRLQAAGRSIAEIQVVLAGATDRMLESAAHLDGPLPAPAAADGARTAQGGGGHARPSETQASDAPAGQARAGKAPASQAQPGHVWPDEAQAAQAQASQAQAGDAQAAIGEAQAGEASEGHREAAAPSRAAAPGGGESVRGRFWAERPGVGAAPAHPGQQPDALPSDDPARERGGDPAREHGGDPARPGGDPAREPGTQRSEGPARPAGTRPAAIPPTPGAAGEAGVPSGRGAGGEAGALPLGGPSQAASAPPSPATPGDRAGTAPNPATPGDPASTAASDGPASTAAAGGPAGTAQSHGTSGESGVSSSLTPAGRVGGSPDRTLSREPGARGEGGERVWGAGVRGVVVTGVRLGDGVRLVLDTGRVPSEEDVQAVLAAARPLLAVLEERELT